MLDGLKKLKNKLPIKLKFPSLHFNVFSKKLKLYRIWKRFLRQIPPTFRHFIRSYPSHFIVMGDLQSGKSQLIQKFIDRERDVYSFETMLTAEPEIQFYLGQRYILQEIAWSIIEDRGIRVKKELSRLWRHLYRDRDPTVVITYNTAFWEKADSEKINHHARLLLNKISLLSHLIDKPITIRIALTHIDRMEGYTEFLKVLRIHGVSLDIPLAFYDDKTLKDTFESYEKYLPLVLKNCSAEEYLRALRFLKKLPDLSFSIDQFFRSLMQKEFEKKLVTLDKAFFISNQEIDIASDVFDCNPSVTPSVFIKRHYFKHQMASACLALLGCSYLGGMAFSQKQQLVEIRQKISLLEKYQSAEHLEKVLPALQPLVKIASSQPWISSLPPLFYSSYHHLIHDFIEYSKDYVLPPTFQRILLKKQSEIEMVYFLGLAKASRNNKLAALISENSEEWAQMLNLPHDFVKSYVTLCTKPEQVKTYLDNFNTLYVSTPLTDNLPWIHFFNHVKKVTESPLLLETHLSELQQEADKLGSILEKLKNHSLTPFVAKILLEDEELKTQKNFLPKIQLLQTLRENHETLENFIKQIQQTNVVMPSYGHLNLVEFISVLDTLLSNNLQPSSSYHFILAGQPWFFESSAWNKAVVNFQAKKIVDDYIGKNRDSEGKVFFKNVGDLFDLDLSYLEEMFPFFKGKTIPAYFTQSSYTTCVFSAAEKLSKLGDSLDPNIKNDLNKFVVAEVEGYARAYKDHYCEVLNLFNTHPDSFEETKKVVTHITEPLSHFTRFLQTLKTHLKLPISESLVLNPMHHLAEFQFFDSLLPQEADKPGQLFNYQTILKEMVETLKTSPLAKFSLANLTHQENSYLTQVETWLVQAEVPVKYHPFFLNPVRWMHEFGLKDLEISIQHEWENECGPAIASLFSKFPFDPSSAEVAGLEEVKSLLHPTSPLWQKVEQILGWVSQKNNGKWLPLYTSVLKLDETIYTTMNTVAKTAHLLWDEKGNPRPLQLKVKTVPFKKPSSNKLPILSYLITKGQSLFNINQRPEWETLTIHWWEQDDISIGLELMEGETKKRTYQNIKIEKQPWNFFQLLKQARQKDDHVWQWNLSGNADHEFALYFQENPWLILKGVAP